MHILRKTRCRRAGAACGNCLSKLYFLRGIDPGDREVLRSMRQAGGAGSAESAGSGPAATSDSASPDSTTVCKSIADAVTTASRASSAWAGCRAAPLATCPATV